MKYSALVALTLTTVSLAPLGVQQAGGRVTKAVPASQPRCFPLDSPDGLRLHNVTAQPVRYAGKRGVRVTTSDSAQRRVAGLPIGQQSQLERLAVIEGTDFVEGVIEAEIAGEPAPGAAAGARGFVGIAFRVQPDLRTYDAFYLRPTNGRAHFRDVRVRRQ